MNVELYDNYQNLLEKYNKVTERNKMLMRNNTKLYRNIRLLRLQTKTSISQPKEHVDLKTLAEATINLAKDSEASVKDIVIPYL